MAKLAQEAYENRPDRAGRKGTLTYLPVELAQRLKIYAAQRDITVQSIGEEAFRLWFKKHGHEIEESSSEDAARFKDLVDTLFQDRKSAR